MFCSPWHIADMSWTLARRPHHLWRRARISQRTMHWSRRHRLSSYHCNSRRCYSSHFCASWSPAIFGVGRRIGETTWSRHKNTGAVNQLTTQKKKNTIESVTLACIVEYIDIDFDTLNLWIKTGCNVHAANEKLHNMNLLYSVFFCATKSSTPHNNRRCQAKKK